MTDKSTSTDAAISGDGMVDAGSVSAPSGGLGGGVAWGAGASPHDDRPINIAVANSHLTCCTLSDIRLREEITIFLN